MDYIKFAGINVRIVTKDGDIYDGLVWGFLFEDETEEVLTEHYTFDVSDIASIEKWKE